jgi:PKD repeat protein
MRTSHALAFVLGLTRLGTACGGDRNGPSNAPPAAAFTPTCILLVCTFTDGSTDADGQLTAYAWDFGDRTAAAITKDAVHTYETANTYSVRLTVTDNDGATNDLTQPVQVHAPANVPPTPTFTTSCTGLACSFTGLGSDGDGTVVGFQWNFGDGTGAATQNATHAYASAGTYAVELTVTDDGGETGHLSQQVTVTVPQTAAPTISLGASRLLQNLCYPARHYSTRGCPSGGSVTISNTGGGTLKWTSTTSAPWLKSSPRSGTAPSTITVWVDGAALPPGSYSGDILISAEGATNSPRGVFVHVTR